MKTPDKALPRVAVPAVLLFALVACDQDAKTPVAAAPETKAESKAPAAASEAAVKPANGLVSAKANTATPGSAKPSSTSASTAAVKGGGAAANDAKGLSTRATAERPSTGPTRPDASSPVQIVFEPSELDLGMMQPGVPKTGTVKLTNNGSAAVQIKKAVASCGCTTPNWPREPILAGETAEIEITLKPNLKQGQKLNKRVTLQMMAGPPQVITVKGEVGLFVDIAPDFLDAAKQASTDQQMVVLTSADETPFSVIAVEPPVLTGIGGDKALRHEMEVDWVAWEEAGRRPLLKLTTDHPNAPELSMTVRRAITRDKPLPPPRTVASSSKIAAAAKANDVAGVQAAITGGSKVDETDQQGMTSLLWAAKNGNTKIIELLLASGADVNNGNRVGKTAVAIAAESGHLAALQGLLDNGGAIETKDEIGGTPLLWAAALSKKPETVGLLIAKGADVNIIDNNGMTPLIWAAGIGRPEAVRMLVDGGADLEVIEIHQRETALMRAARIGDIENLRILVDAKADLGKTNMMGQSAAIIAASSAPVEKMRVLVEAGADLGVRDTRGWSVLDHARARTDAGRGEILEYLEANVPDEIKNATPVVGG